MMASIQARRAVRARAAGGQAQVAGGRARAASREDGRGHRPRARLWALLNAQALLGGTAGPRGGAAAVEDDRRRLAGRRAG